MRVGRRAAQRLIILGAAAVGLLVVAAVPARTALLTTRHTVTLNEALIQVHGPVSDYWLRSSYRRETWFRPNGSGRISETREAPSFPTPDDAERSHANGDIAPPPLNERFGAGGLAYTSSDGLVRALDALRRSADADAGRALGEIASRLVEAAPDPQRVQEVVEAARGRPPITITESGAIVELSATADGLPVVRHIVTIDVGRGRLLRYRQIVEASVPGLAISPPFVRLDRQILVSEMVGFWE